MFKFFRSIRQNLLNENKTAKYLKYAAGEIVLVMIGILLALQVNTWNQNRLLRVEEIEAISRILFDVEGDVQALDIRIGTLEEKDTSLLRVKSTIENGKVADPQSFLNDIIEGSQFGWSQRGANRSTYDDLTGAGKLGIIKNAEVRATISAYYNNFLIQQNRIDSRETGYPNLSYQLVERNYGGDFQLMTGLTYEQTEDLAKHALETLTIDEVREEINFGRFTHTSSSGIQNRAKELMEVLKDYFAEIQK
jgi:hypothetical protein